MSTTLPPWDSLGFTFGTEPEQLTAVPQCSNVTVDYYGTIDNNRVATPPPTAPYHLVIYAANSQPLTIPLRNPGTSGQYVWRMNLPVGQNYAVSMKDAAGYSGGILAPVLRVVAGTNCNAGASPLQPPTLDVSVSGSAQCGQTVISVNNGTAPYAVEMVPVDNRQQKTIRFASSPFALMLDISAGTSYFLSVTDSADHASVQGIYTSTPSADNTCLGAASTITAGMVSTVYPGGTASATMTAPTESPHKLASGAVIGIAVAVPVAVIILVLLGLWLCYRRSRRQHPDRGDRPEIEPYGSDVVAQGGYAPVSTSNFNSGPRGNSYHDLSSADGSQRPLTSVSYSPVIHSPGGTPKASPLSSTGPIASEPFDLQSLGGQPSQHRMPPLPPPYAPSPGRS